jgi:hypothetical protein
LPAGWRTIDTEPDAVQLSIHGVKKKNKNFSCFFLDFLMDRFLNVLQMLMSLAAVFIKREVLLCFFLMQNWGSSPEGSKYLWAYSGLLKI